MGKLENLLQQAAVIRDATEEKENTATRVGTMFVDFIQSCIAVLPGEIVNGAGISVTSSDNNFIIRYGVVADDGGTEMRSITIPVSSSSNAGLLSASLHSQIVEAVSAISGVLTRMSAVESALDDKADTADVESALAMKANIADVESALKDKANKTGSVNIPFSAKEINLGGSGTTLVTLKQGGNDGAEVLEIVAEDAMTSGERSVIVPIPNSSEGDSVTLATTKQLEPLATKSEMASAIGTATEVLDGEIDALEDAMAPNLFKNGNVLTNNVGSYVTLEQFIALTKDMTAIQRAGFVVALVTSDGIKNYQWKGGTWNDKDAWRDFGGSASVGNCYNVTNEIPKSGYYDLESAIAATYGKGLAAVGMQITFAVGAGTWKTYQYVGDDVTESKFKTESNWVDMAGMSAGDEAVINVNDLCGAPSSGGYYTLSSARDAISNLSALTGINYKKSGLVITYMSGENAWETKQFNGVVEDFTNDSLWADFGGGGGTPVEVSDEPVADGTDAFSTGGAYNHLADSVAAMSEEEIEAAGITPDDDYNYYRLTNEEGNKIGTPFALPKGGGGGTGDVKVTSIAFQKSPLAAAAGSEDFKIKAAIRSVTGDTEWNISTIAVIDNTTKQTLMTLSPDQASSASGTDYSFEINVSQFCQSAGTRYLRITATDDDIKEGASVGTSFSRIITVKAVDVTVATIDNLASNVCAPTDTAKVLTLYQFPNNQGSSIQAKVDIFVKDEWVNLATTTVKDNSFHAVTINATNVDGEKLAHGSYLMRVQGTDVESGVVGNMVYTSLMVIDPESDVPVVAIRYNDESGAGTIRQYDTLTIDVAAYKSDSQSVAVALLKNDATVSGINCNRNRTYQITQQVQESGTAENPTSLVFQAVAHSSASEKVTIKVMGSVLEDDVTLSDGALYNFDFSARSNNESDHSIISGDYEISVKGANWSSNGFVNYLGANALRVAENVTAELNHAPFGSSTIESDGMGLQFAFASRHIMDESARLMECYDPASGAGFYVTGNTIAIYCLTGTPQLVERRYSPGTKVTVGIVVEPTTADNLVEQLGVTYAMMKLYINGEEAGCIGYRPGNSALVQEKNITIDGTKGDFYLYWLIAWDKSQGIDWQQSFYNYLVKVTDTAAMVTEYGFEKVFTGVKASGPARDEIYKRGMPYLIEAPFLGSDVTALDGTTSTDDYNYITLYYYNPERPWMEFVAYSVARRNQGTTSAKRPIKNARYYLKKKKGMADKDGNLIGYDIVNGITKLGTTYYGTHVELLHTRQDIIDMGYDGALWDEANALVQANKVRVGDNTIPVDVITVKVDYSDSTNANDCGACNLMNATYRMLGSEYMTPAQRYFDGTFKVNDELTLTGLQLNHSTANHPIAMYRSADEAINNPTFYAKGNWKEDKGEQVALGFKDTPGYNKGCLNYQDGTFVEFYGTSGETLAQTVARFLASGTEKDTSKRYLISQYCGSSYKFYRYVDGAWTDTTGTMKQVNGKWTVTGDVLNPVEGFELLTYQGLCWWQGVSSVADMMATGSGDKSSWVQKLINKNKIKADDVPAWTRYFECMVDSDDLAIAYASGKKVPYFLYRLLKWCDSVDYSKVNGFESKWRNEAYKYLSPQSLSVYYLFTDYKAAVDQQAKNYQPMFFLDDGGVVEYGVYASEDKVRMYSNKVYDADTLDGDDNDGGETIDPETDPTILDPSNPYMGYGSVLWQDLNKQPEMLVNADGGTLNLYQVASLMRTSSTTVNGRTIFPFSPEGCKYFAIEQIIEKWQKTVSSFDGERKYIKSPTQDTTIYFYALHGLRLTALPAFIEKRFEYRDAHYRTGSFTSGVIGGRINAPDNAKVRITAAKSGYFAIGNDAGGSITDSVTLEAGESYEFNVGLQNSGKLLYIYQAHRLSKIDVSELSLDSTWGFGLCELLEELVIGGEDHTELPMSVGTPLTGIVLGDLPFLKTIDIRNTSLTSLDASGCPRLEEILADDTELASLTLAQTAPIDTLALPATITGLQFVNLPNLTYPGGLTAEGLGAVVTLRIEGSEGINASALLKTILAAQTASNKLNRLRIANQTVKGDGTELTLVVERGVQGIDADGGAMAMPVIAATYQLTKLYETWEIEEWEAAIYGLTVITVIDAYIAVIDAINNESYGGDSEVETVTLENVDELAFLYYNGESYDDYLATYADENADINEVVTQ